MQNEEQLRQRNKAKQVYNRYQRCKRNKKEAEKELREYVEEVLAPEDELLQDMLDSVDQAEDALEDAKGTWKDLYKNPATRIAKTEQLGGDDTVQYNGVVFEVCEVERYVYADEPVNLG